MDVLFIGMLFAGGIYVIATIFDRISSSIVGQNPQESSLEEEIGKAVIKLEKLKRKM